MASDGIASKGLNKQATVKQGLSAYSFGNENCSINVGILQGKLGKLGRNWAEIR